MWIGQTADRQIQPATGRPEPLGPGQREHLAALVAELMPDWSVELRHDVLGSATIVIVPEDLDDANGPILFVHREASAFHFEELRWGRYRKLDEYQVWADVLRAVRIRLAWEAPFPTTLTDQRC